MNKRQELLGALLFFPFFTLLGYLAVVTFFNIPGKTDRRPKAVLFHSKSTEDNADHRSVIQKSSTGSKINGTRYSEEREGHSQLESMWEKKGLDVFLFGMYF